jgi:hypothetical protein
MLDSARRAWEAPGYSVKGAALAGIAAQCLANAQRITPRTLAAWERSWDTGYELGKRDGRHAPARVCWRGRGRQALTSSWSVSRTAAGNRPGGRCECDSPPHLEVFPAMALGLR